jgi:hypothetical protein
MSQDAKRQVPVEPFQLRVLGGNFTVSELVLDVGEPQEAFMSHLRDIPADRWFVMVAEEEREDSQDTLAVIDDNFEFQIYAVGTFVNE